MAISNPENTKTFFTDLISEKADLSDDSLAREATNQIAAGTDTTAVTLTFLVWVLLKRPDVKAKLSEELDSLPVGWTTKDLEALPYLNCVIEETLRLYNPAPSTLPRVVPKGGRELGGYFVPEGTVVGTMTYSLHRSREIFERPLE